MTPLSRFYSRYLPVQAIWPAMTLTYAATILLLLLAGSPNRNDIVYIDIETLR